MKLSRATQAAVAAIPGGVRRADCGQESREWSRPQSPRFRGREAEKLFPRHKVTGIQAAVAAIPGGVRRISDEKRLHARAPPQSPRFREA